MWKTGPWFRSKRPTQGTTSPPRFGASLFRSEEGRSIHTKVHTAANTASSLAGLGIRVTCCGGLLFSSLFWGDKHITFAVRRFLQPKEQNSKRPPRWSRKSSSCNSWAANSARARATELKSPSLAGEREGAGGPEGHGASCRG